MGVGDTTKTITLPKDEWAEDSFGKKIPQKSLIQFIQGTVALCQVGEDNPKLANDTNELGCIWALPSVGNIGMKKETVVPKDDRFKYTPLLRGMQDIPDIGDPVLLCEFGGQKYYLGPLNADNSPNNNLDRLRGNQIATGEERGSRSDSQNDSSMQQLPLLARMGKRINAELDNPVYHTEELSKDDEGNELAPIVSADMFTQHGDMIFEGRHGNSIRIGSRNINPYIYLSNARPFTNTFESTLDGSLIAITKQGSIRQHFRFDRETIENKDPEKATQSEKRPFTLADDKIEKVHRSISKTFTTSMGRGLGPDGTEYNQTYKRAEPGNKGSETAIPDPDINKTIYGYRKNQVFITSDRLMFNARLEDVFIAAKQYMHFGAGNNINLSTSNTFLVEAATSMVVNTPMFKVHAPGKVYIDGRKNTDKDNNVVGSIFLGNPLLGDHLQPAVMGTALVDYLVNLITEMQSICYAVGEAIGARDNPTGPTSVMELRVAALDELMGKIGVEDAETETSYEYPQGMVDRILSNSVMIKK